MIKRIIILLSIMMISLLSVSSCDQEKPKKKGADNYHFLHKQYVKETMLIKITVYKSYADLQKALEEKYKHQDSIDFSSVAAFSSLFPPDFNYCEIHMIDPEVDYMPEYVGHEFLHCFYGQWHLDNNKR